MADQYDLTKIKGYSEDPKNYSPGGTNSNTVRGYTDQLYKSDPNTYLGVPIYNQFMSTYGRAPTQDEFAIYAPQVVALGHQGAMAEIARNYQAEQNTPDKLAKKQQDQLLADAPKHFDAVNSLFQSQLGRSATQDELNHFGSLLASGTTDPYQLQNFLKQQPEYTSKQDQAFQEGLTTKAKASDAQYLQEQAIPALQAQAVKSGRSLDSSGVTNSALQFADKQNQARDQYIMNLSASQYGGRQDQAYNAYKQYIDNQNGVANNNINAQYQQVLSNQLRGQSISDFQTQQQSYNQYLAKYGKRNNGIGGAVGGGLGAVVGAYYGGPMGASAGYTAGTALGTAAQNYMGGSY